MRLYGQGTEEAGGEGGNRIPGHSYPAGDITGDCIKEKDTDINEEIPAKPKIIQNIRKGGQPGKCTRIPAFFRGISGSEERHLTAKIRLLIDISG